ncbi:MULTISPECIES: hypothetical protein [Paenibacillus]|uniref:Uncharacterized protein n=1 Tax=Paenibacillus odorifer TaxID=189426 RepID=A0A1R0X154_9BACL|nr:hypothetical protein [Paenibacillus odorifer]OMD26220.1 hypothetical protein BJP51_27455 [Paenibacillus odorifer]
MRYLNNELVLVFPPLSNQEASWLSNDKEVEEKVQHSKIYMIGQRKELLFTDYSYDMDNNIFLFKLKMGNLISPPMRFYLGDDFLKWDVDFQDAGLEIGDRLFRVTDLSTNRCILWFTPTVLMYQISHNQLTVRTDSEFDFRQFSTYELLYVGISKENSSLLRLFEDAHHGRLNILTNAHPKAPTSRVTDELIIFMFDICALNINVFSTTEDIENDMNYQSDKIKVIADAEKAFVKLLDTEYNSVKYEQYPKGRDGLFQDQLTRYGYSLKEDITFYTRQGEFHGTIGYSDPCDLILIEDDVAKVIKAYED